MKACAAEDVGDSRLPHQGTEDLETPYKVADEFGEFVHWLRHSHECVGPLLIESCCPGRDRQRCDQESCRSLRERPASSRAELKDREPLDGRIVWPALRRDLFYASV